MKRRRKTGTGLLLCLVLLLTAAVLFFAGRENRNVRTGELSFPVRISEVLTRNASYPDPLGRLSDAVELENTSDRPVNLGGYGLSDTPDGVKYVFPAETEIPAGGCLLVWCSSEDTTGTCAPFALSRSGGEELCLMNSAGVVLDRALTVPCPRGYSLVREENGGLTACDVPTPGFPNTPEGLAAFRLLMGGEAYSIRINEIMSSNASYPNESGELFDWIELTNAGTEPRDIAGYSLTDTPGKARYAFPAGTVLQPGDCLRVDCARSAGGALAAPFGLSATAGETLVLCNASGIELQRVELPPLEEDSSYAFNGEEWIVTFAVTPGQPNSSPAAAPAESTLTGFIGGGPVIVSEAAPTNPGVYACADGTFPDWLELANIGTGSADLSDWWLSDDEKAPKKWQIPRGTVLQPGECLLIWADGTGAEHPGLCVGFSLSVGETVCLSTPEGEMVSALTLADAEKGQSVAVRGENAVPTSWCTPGYPNSDDGYAALQDSLVCTSPLQFLEVVTTNSRWYFQPNTVGYCDFLQLINNSQEPLSLQGYYLTDDYDEPLKWALPQGMVQPGASVTYFCSGDESNSTTSRYIHTNFSISSSGETLYLFREDGSLADYIRLHDVPFEGSCGRMTGKNGYFYFASASPTQEDFTGARMISETPVSPTQDGVFEGVDGVTVELSGSGPIYYTTNGAVPTAEDTLYTGPFKVSKTTVIRAASVSEDKLTGTPLTLSFILNEGHSLPVMSLVAEPSQLFHNGIYTACNPEREVPCSVSLFEENGSFTAECGLKMYGHTALYLPKKSMKLKFRSRFGDEALQYDVFGNGVESRSDLVVRAGQDYPYAIVRDELLTRLCNEFTDNVLAQSSKYCILYINGDYWGIYCLKEAFTGEFYAQTEGVSPESVTQIQAPAPVGSEFYDVFNYVWKHDMSVDENYREFCDMVDIDSVIDWCIIEGYSANADVQQNLRYFRSTENGNRWQLAFYDLDWAFYYDNNLNMVFYGIGEDGSFLQHCIYTSALLSNADFRDRFCTRLAEALAGTLSEEHVLATLDSLAAEIDPEVERERERWGSSYLSWQTQLQSVRDFVTNGWTTQIIDGAAAYCGLTPEERIAYFGEIEGITLEELLAVQASGTQTAAEAQPMEPVP